MDTRQHCHLRLEFSVSSTDNYYKRHTRQFVEDTLHTDMSSLYEPFLAALPAKAHILDAGCGSARDALAFQQIGHQVSAFDANEELASHASTLLGFEVPVARFEDFAEVARYDGIWACASMLHVPELQLPDVFERLWRALKTGGVLYCSFKYGQGQREHQGRHFTDANETRISEWTTTLTSLSQTTCWVTQDQRPGRNEHWLNVLLHKTASKLVTGGSENPFLPHLCSAIHQALRIDMAVAFIKTTGLRLLLPDLLESLQRTDSTLPPAQIRILTSDYLDVTDPEALRLLVQLAELGADVHVYQSSGSSFHLKAYLFAGRDWGRAFIGSSNISRQALQQGLEWNYQINYPGDDGYLEACQRFDELFAHPRSKPLTHAWIDDYERRRIKPVQSFEAGSTETEPPPTPSKIQQEALNALRETREQGYLRGLVVLATGLGKTWLAAFDVKQMGARRVLFVAHREEILNQAAETFTRIQPSARVGFYRGQQRDNQADILCASVQTLGKAEHLERFKPQHFDYIVVDEFHHASAPTYHRLLQHFAPTFLLGLTATPDRTDNASILALCDDNLVYSCNLFSGVNEKLLAPFHYYGIFDSDVDYQAIPWRNGRFDPELLANKLATLGRARHALSQWRLRAQTRTLAFCASTLHADYMAAHFRKEGVRAASVYADSPLSRGEALEQLRSGALQVLFSVDLFNEGVDLPLIDTVMMLRPTESKILFLQQLGRGLRKAEGKDKLVVLDFVANHKSFLHKPMALINQNMNHRQLAEFARKAEQGHLELPEGCFVNYDLRFIDFLKSLDSGSVQNDYRALRDTLGRRPSLTEFHFSGSSLQDMRLQFGHWFALVATEETSLPETQRAIIGKHGDFLRELETTAMTKSYKMVLLEAFLELDGWREAVELEPLAERSWQVLQRRRPLLGDLPEEYQGLSQLPGYWLSYWKKNPIAAWSGGRYFSVEDGLFIGNLLVDEAAIAALSELVQELVDFRLATYAARANLPSATVHELPSRPQQVELAYFPSLKIACGHFRTSRADYEEYRRVSTDYGNLDSALHFLARASGNSMNGGKQPIKDGDYLLLEVISSEGAGKISDQIIAIERQDESGDNQYLLRKVLKDPNGQYRLRANNPDYADILVSDELQEQFRTFARLKAVIDPLDMQVGEDFMREEIPALFGVEFNAGNWNSGHVVIAKRKAHVLLVTLNKQGKAEELRYQDHWIDERHFHWQTQNKTTPEGKWGKEIINHAKLGISLHLFVRENKLQNGKAAPFRYYGQVNYQSHTGSGPMSVHFELA
jgi:superfamily II DNA or RNA helicase/HKD family nuclease/SAM-dependent methyltransferase/SOS-response transcriptional repressor LexA